MNAVATQNSKFGTFKWLLKREFWENRGGFLWAPVVAGGIASFFAAAAAIIGTLLGRKNGIIVAPDADDAAHIARVAGEIGDVALLVGIGLSLAVLTFVIFFYALGSLYDDRRDRSVLFWKSLPVSDRDTVLSKLAWILLLAPLLALAVGIATGFVFWLIAVLTTTVNGVPGGYGVLLHSHPLRIVGNVLLAFPVQILWALPAVGWLMLCSAWAKRFPFLWAVLIPFLFCAMAGVVVLALKITAGIELPYGTLLYVVLYRGLLSIAPNSWMAVTHGIEGADADHPDQFASQLDFSSSWHAFATPDLWTGVAVGIAFIAAAVYLRRWRELAD